MATKDQQQTAAMLAIYLSEKADSLEDLVGPDMVPDLSARLTPLGCGTFGCVYAIPRPGWVLKVTLDESEGAFVAAAQAIGRFPPGIVRYDLLIDDATRQELYEPLFGPKQTLFMLWREEAFFGPETQERRASAEQGLRAHWAKADGLRVAQRRMLGLARRKGESAQAKRDHTKAELQFAKQRRDYELLLEGPVREDALPIRDMLLFYLRQGWVLRDLRIANFGVVRRRDREIVVVTDPGQAFWIGAA